MLPTYRAIIENNQIRWLEEEPEQGHQRTPLKVLITVIEEAPQSADQAKSKKAAAILNRMAARNALAGITDPVAWQGEYRDAPSLPERK